MPLGYTSLSRLETCHPKLQRLIKETVKRMDRRRTLDLAVDCGHRGEKEQELAFKAGKSSKHWPDSRHNTMPSTAVDLACYPRDYSDTHWAAERIALVIGYVLAVADELDIEVEVGINWKDPHDPPHIQLTDRELNRP